MSRVLEVPDGTYGNVAIEWRFRSPIVNISRYRCLATDREPAEDQTQPCHVICFPHERGFLYHEENSATVVDPTTQRLLARELEDPAALDPSAVIETALALAASAVASAFPAARASRPSATRRERQARDRVEAVRSEIARAYDRHQPLEELAARAGFSVYHLCRTFRRHTGLPVHRYRNRLRLRAALERLADPRVDLTGRALDVGFSSHSHFTAAFRAEFGVTPSQVRRSRLKAIRSRLFWPPPSNRNVSVM